MIWAGLQRYGWEAHNGQTYGRQALHDARLDISSTFVKSFRSGARGGDWAVRVSVRRRETLENPRPETLKRQRHEETVEEERENGGRVSLIFYVADEDVRFCFSCLLQ